MSFVRYAAWFNGIGALAVAATLGTIVAWTESAWLVPAVIGGTSLFFLPVALVLLLGFRHRLGRVERWVTAIPVLLVAANVILVVVVTLLRPVGVGSG